jgi:DNA-binding transcriptional LysR family regulator
MSVSQPTVSYCLKRLRGCFDDTLFASSQGVLLPTTKAEKIAPYLRMVMTAKDKPIATVVGNSFGQLKAGGPIAVAAPLASSYMVAGPKRGKSPVAAKAKKAASRPASPRARKSSQEQ